MPPGLVRRPPSPSSTRLERWRRTEPVRLYAYSVLAALALVLVATGALTGDVGHTLTGLAAAVLGVVPAAEAARASVWSPASRSAERMDDAARFAAIVQRDAA